MSRIASIAIVLMITGSSSLGSAVVHLLPEVVEVEASDTPTTVSFEVYMSNEDGQDHYLRLMQYDFELTELPHANFDFHYNSESCNTLGGDQCASGYAELNLDETLPATVFTGLFEDTFQQILLPGDGTAILTASFDIEVPASAAGESYFIDVLNPDTPNGGFGARIDFGFGGPDDPILTWNVFNGLITGNSAFINVVPEPASLAVLAVGALALGRRRGQTSFPKFKA